VNADLLEGFEVLGEAVRCGAARAVLIRDPAAQSRVDGGRDDEDAVACHVQRAARVELDDEQVRRGAVVSSVHRVLHVVDAGTGERHRVVAVHSRSGRGRE